MPNDRFDLAGRVAVVTGGTGHLGSRLSKGLAGAGAHVTLVSRSVEQQQHLAGEIAAQGGSCDAVPCDLGDLDAVTAMCDEVWDRHGRIDVVVHNATGGARTEESRPHRSRISTGSRT